MHVTYSKSDALLGGGDRRNTEVETVDDRVVLGALILL
jgi:hypothetical protein